MQVTVHGSGGRQGIYKARIEQVAVAAGTLVADHMGGLMPNVRIILTDGAGVTRLIERADHEMASGGEDGAALGPRPALGFVDALSKGAQSHPLGKTALERRGTLVVINGPRQKGLKGLDETLVHELVHCMQLNVPETRARHIAFLRQLYNVEPHSSDFGPYQQLLDEQEVEAYGMEKPLARRLPPPLEAEE